MIVVAQVRNNTCLIMKCQIVTIDLDHKVLVLVGKQRRLILACLFAQYRKFSKCVYEHEIPELHTADQPTTPFGRAIEN